MKKCSICKQEEAIAKIQWIGKQAVKTPFYPCLDCFLRVTTELIRAHSSKDEDLPECDNRILCLGSNVCLGNEPYSCERMFRDYECPRGYEKRGLK